jgi:transcriptional regulator with XRE-family HTH domain
MNELGKKIKQRREELGLSQDELARMLGYKHKSSINKIELGAADVPRAKVPAFAKALGMTAIEFSGWTEERKALSFSYCMEQQMRILGWVVLYDADGNVILTHEGAEYEITEESMKELESRVALYLDRPVDRGPGGRLPGVC